MNSQISKISHRYGMKALLASTIVFVPASHVQAQEYLCVEEAAIGFNWEGDKWVNSRFATEKRLIKKLALDDKFASSCAREIERDDLNTNVVFNEYSGLAYGCYQNSIIGKEPRYGEVCREIYKKEGEMWAVRCDNLVDYDFAPNGEYISVSSYSIPDPSNRDSLAMIIGACSQLK